MPELPEVEQAAGVARRVAQGRTITSLSVLHRSQRRSLPARDARRLLGRRVERVERRGKTQYICLTGDFVLAVHFRMTGDWNVLDSGAALPPHARLVIGLDDGRRLVLDDPRALSVVSLGRGDAAARPGLGPEPTEPAFTAAALARALSTRRGAIKPVLLDQRVVAGLGNIYVAEALWRARIDPRTPARTLSAARCARLVTAIRAVIAGALRRVRRYSDMRSAARPSPFAVYDRAGLACRRCGTAIRRIVQAGRSTYFCPHCQR